MRSRSTRSTSSWSRPMITRSRLRAAVERALGGRKIGLGGRVIVARLIDLALRRRLVGEQAGLAIEHALGERELRLAPFRSPCSAAIRSVCACTTSGLSISNSGSPRLTSSPILAISRVTRPENGVSTTVLASSLKAIWPIAGFWMRN